MKPWEHLKVDHKQTYSNKYTSETFDCFSLWACVLVQSTLVRGSPSYEPVASVHMGCTLWEKDHFLGFLVCWYKWDVPCERNTHGMYIVRERQFSGLFSPLLQMRCMLREKYTWDVHSERKTRYWVRGLANLSGGRRTPAECVHAVNGLRTAFDGARSIFWAF